MDPAKLLTSIRMHWPIRLHSSLKQYMSMATILLKYTKYKVEILNMIAKKLFVSEGLRPIWVPEPGLWPCGLDPLWTHYVLSPETPIIGTMPPSPSSVSIFVVTVNDGLCKVTDCPWGSQKQVKIVNLYRKSSQTRLQCAFVTNQSRLPHGHRVQPADTGWCSGRLGNPSQLYQGPHLP